MRDEMESNIIFCFLSPNRRARLRLETAPSFWHDQDRLHCVVWGPSPLTDSSTNCQSLILEAKAGSEAALHGLAELLSDWLWREFRGRKSTAIGSANGLSDVIQDTLFQAQAQFPHFKGETWSELKGWVHKIFVNRQRQLQRNHAVRLDEETRSAITKEIISRLQTLSHYRSHQEKLECQEQVAQLQRAFDRLESTDQWLIVLRIYDQLKFKTIAEIAESTEDAVRMACKRSLYQLKKYFDSDD